MKIPTASIVKFVSDTPKVTVIDDVTKIISKTGSYLEFPNGAKASNMLDAFIAATGAVVEKYTPDKVVDFLA